MSRKPKTEGIQTGKRHVTRADHQRNQVIGKPEKDGHGYEENHGRTMHGEHAIEHLWRDKIVVRAHQLDADNGCFNTADDEKNQGVKDVQNTQALVIDRGYPHMQHFNPWSTCRFSVLNSQTSDDIADLPPSSSTAVFPDSARVRPGRRRSISLPALEILAL